MNLVIMSIMHRSTLDLAFWSDFCFSSILIIQPLIRLNVQYLDSSSWHEQCVTQINSDPLIRCDTDCVLWDGCMFILYKLMCSFINTFYSIVVCAWFSRLFKSFVRWMALKAKSVSQTPAERLTIMRRFWVKLHSDSWRQRLRLKSQRTTQWSRSRILASQSWS